MYITQNIMAQLNQTTIQQSATNTLQESGSFRKFLARVQPDAEQDLKQPFLELLQQLVDQEVLPEEFLKDVKKQSTFDQGELKDILDKVMQQMEKGEVAPDNLVLLQTIDQLNQSVVSDGKLTRNPDTSMSLQFSGSQWFQGEDNQTRLENIIKSTERMLGQLQKQSLTSQDYKQLIDLLRQWSNQDQSTQNNLTAMLKKDESSATIQVWNKLLKNFQNRQVMNKHYGQAQQVTQQDIAKWIQNAIEQYGGTTKQEVTQTRVDMQASSQMVTSKVQQYVIHVQHTGDDQQLAQKQLLDQFNLAIQKSNFMKLPNGTNQLMLRLQPESLGDVTVRLTQVNGEMVVKMMVASQSAKDLLEGNLHQLRHMFSPNQVAIERQDTVTSSNESSWSQEQEQSDENGQEQEANSQDQQSQEGDEQDPLNFKDLLMDAKV
ncbi:flagellar hook-length control protein FliK [Gracilibacillus caseinilyticus]|uniref:Flagellar hook-length control protein FliK n=1 Tax=Gracilibacillus caseinilyticus TaxID=2932256 RepID=A0ABY4ETY2_9BACI|nr:flagellar hook-length control protein FliK [Gracilibacillus caseinilyticus]UOQ47874.1 flagellar hook-length control protein FliK [Gracilibacillus caseinilyticus]